MEDEESAPTAEFVRPSRCFERNINVIIDVVPQSDQVRRVRTLYEFQYRNSWSEMPKIAFEPRTQGHVDEARFN
jgi:hypothetical protein